MDVVGSIRSRDGEIGEMVRRDARGIPLHPFSRSRKIETGKTLCTLEIVDR